MMVPGSVEPGGTGVRMAFSSEYGAEAISRSRRM